jgi:hypothetical protein
LNGFKKNMGKKKIRRINSNLPIYPDPSRSITFGRPVFFGPKGSSCMPIFLPVIFLAGIQH